MKSVFMVRVYGHTLDSHGVRENQLTSSAYSSSDDCNKSIECMKSRYPNLFHHAEVEEVEIVKFDKNEQFKDLDNYVLELVLGSQGDIIRNLINFANHLKVCPKVLVNFVIDLLESRDLSDDWGNLGSYEDKIGITQEDKTRLISRIKHELH